VTVGLLAFGVVAAGLLGTGLLDARFGEDVALGCAALDWAGTADFGDDVAAGFAVDTACRARCETAAR
jgi:hypothetical protein